MSAVVEAREPSARYLAEAQPALVRQFELLATAPGGVARLRQFILKLATQGKLLRDSAKGSMAHYPGKAPLGEVDVHLPQLPIGWAWTALGEIVDILDSQRQPVKKENRRCGPYPYFGASGVVDHVDAYIFDEPLVLIGEDGAKWGPGEATAFMISGKSWVNNHAHVLRPHRERVIDRYLVVVLTAEDLSRYVTGMTVPKLNQSRLVSIPIPLPTIDEQARIVARVDELMRLCDALEVKGRLEAEQHARLLGTLLGTLTDSSTPEELAANWQRVADHFDLLLDRPEAVDALEQTILQLAVRGLLVQNDPSDEPASALTGRIHSERQRLSMPKSQSREALSRLPTELFNLPANWLWCALEDLVIAGPTNGLSPKPVDEPTGVRCLSLSATTLGHFRNECFKYVDLPLAAARPFRLKRGDLLLQRGNALEYVGIAAIYDQEDDEYIFPDLMIRVRLSAHVDVRYVHMWLICQDGRTYFQRNATGTQGTMPKINQSVVRATPIPLPPLNEQRRIVARIAELRRLCANLRQRLAASQTTQSHLAEALVDSAAA
ncbi:restriction endonuclease subunit S [Ramlibacter sp.]|uniref:restriction endonuclease subunit S n=1 Tax=Ramlibacter sp. TaxID=1917967 RepID=UPI0035B0D160